MRMRTRTRAGVTAIAAIMIAIMTVNTPSGATSQASSSSPTSSSPAASSFDLVVYGGTAGGVITAVTAAREGLAVALLEPGRHLGGMVSGGLGLDRLRPKGSHRRLLAGVLRASGREIRPANRMALRASRRRSGVQRDGQGRGGAGLPRPSAAGEDRRAQVRHPHHRNRDGKRRRVRGQVFADASYEGDVMAQAGVSYTWGREGSRDYSESLAGVRDRTPLHQFSCSGVASATRPASCCPRSCRARKTRSVRPTSASRPTTSASA